jgi:hypothetical protein
MHPEYEEPVGSGTPAVEYYVFDGVPIPDEVYEQAMISENKAYTEDPILTEFMLSPTMRRMFSRHSQFDRTGICLFSVHVHIGYRGLTAHSHDYEFPNVLSAVIYLNDGTGALVIDPDGINVEVLPKAGRLVLMSSSIVHAVKPSVQAELRVALVANYE